MMLRDGGQDEQFHPPHCLQVASESLQRAIMAEDKLLTAAHVVAVVVAVAAAGLT
jgi:hypothetical protein